jgi:hypothetical protein
MSSYSIVLYELQLDVQSQTYMLQIDQLDHLAKKNKYAAELL